MRQLRRNALSAAAAQTALPWATCAFAQHAPEAGTIGVTGQRAAIQPAQKIKHDAEENVGSIVAEDIGKLRDKRSHGLSRLVTNTCDTQFGTAGVLPPKQTLDRSRSVPHIVFDSAAAPARARRPS